MLIVLLCSEAKIYSGPADPRSDATPDAHHAPARRSRRLIPLPRRQ